MVKDKGGKGLEKMRVLLCVGVCDRELGMEER